MLDLYKRSLKDQNKTQLSQVLRVKAKKMAAQTKLIFHKIKTNEGGNFKETDWLIAQPVRKTCLYFGNFIH